MRRIAIVLLCFVAVVIVLTGCGNSEPLEDAKPLEANGYSTNYHQYMWTRVGTTESESISESSYQYKDSDAFFAIVRISAETAKAQGLVTPESMETLLMTYVANYNGTDQKITPADNDLEYIRELTFVYDDHDMDEEYTYLAKLVLNKESGEMMVVLAAYPSKSDTLLKNEVELIMNDAVMGEIVTV